MHIATPTGARAAGLSQRDPYRLRAEANQLHRALFGGDAPTDVQAQYEGAIAGHALAGFPSADLSPLIERGVDVEALEIALRRINPVNALTQRVHVLCYLVEARPEYFDRFMAERASFARGLVTLALHSLRSAHKLVKGRWLIRIHHVV